MGRLVYNRRRSTVIGTDKAVDGKAMGLMFLLCIIWGLQPVVLKAAAPDIAPILQIALRSGIAALLVRGVMFLRRERIAWGDGDWHPGLLVLSTPSTLKEKLVSLSHPPTLLGKTRGLRQGRSSPLS